MREVAMWEAALRESKVRLTALICKSEDRAVVASMERVLDLKSKEQRLMEALLRLECERDEQAKGWK